MERLLLAGLVGVVACLASISGLRLLILDLGDRVTPSRSRPHTDRRANPNEDAGTGLGMLLVGMVTAALSFLLVRC